MNGKLINGYFYPDFVSSLGGERVCQIGPVARVVRSLRNHLQRILPQNGRNQWILKQPNIQWTLANPPSITYLDIPLGIKIAIGNSRKILGLLAESVAAGDYPSSFELLIIQEMYRLNGLLANWQFGSTPQKRDISCIVLHMQHSLEALSKAHTTRGHTFAVNKYRHMAQQSIETLRYRLEIVWNSYILPHTAKSSIEQIVEK